MFLNGDLNVMNGNKGLEKSRSNTIAITTSINRIVEQNSYKDPHLTCLMKGKSSTIFAETFDESAFYEKIGTAFCCNFVFF